MLELVKVGESIEGLVIEGYSRKPLAGKGMVVHQGRRCYRYIAKFDVKANIKETIDIKAKLIEINANLGIDAHIICDAAIIHSFKDKYTQKVVSNVSGTHSSNAWHFSTQTNVQITRPHQDIENGRLKRESKKLRD